MLVLFNFLESKPVPNVVPFAGLILLELGFQSVKCYNTSWHSFFRLLGSLTLHSETAVEDFIASQAPQLNFLGGK